MIDDTRQDEQDALRDSETPSEDRFKAIREAFQTDMDAVKDLYDEAEDDFRFAWVPGNQWDNHLQKLRGTRPKYEFNLVRQWIKQVINDNRKNTPSIKVRPVRDGTKEIADIRQSLIRNIEATSNADIAYDWAALYAITSGFGCFEVCTEYSDEEGFDQDIRIKRITNPFAVFFDAAAQELDRSDARRAWVVEQMPRAEFRKKYPKAEVVDFEARRDSTMLGWFDRDTVRVCAYWYKKQVKQRIYQLSDGRVVDADGFDEIAEAAANPPPDANGVVNPITVALNAAGERMERTIYRDEVYKEIISGRETLEGPFRWAGKYIPIIPVWGDIVSDNGRDYWYGMVRPARDAQVVFNFSQSNGVEVIANQPKAPWLYTPKMVEGFKEQWANSAIENAAGLPYNPDSNAPGGRPTREPAPEFPVAWFNLARVNMDNLKAVSGIHNASLGMESNETSGRAILARQHEGDVATFDYSDNIVRAIQFCGTVVNDLIDSVYDVEREIRILGEDMAEDYIRINQPVLVNGQWEKQNDINQGKYDVVVTTGPSFTTQRMELLDVMSKMMQTPGPFGALAAFSTMKYMDVPGTADDLAVMRKMLIQQGMPLKPEEGDQPPPPPQPNPKDVAAAEKDKAQAANYAAQAEGRELENQERAYQFGMRVGTAGPPPMQAPQPQQPPEGGFFVPPLQ